MCRNQYLSEEKFVLRPLALYSTYDEPSYELELCQARKKVAISAF